MPAYGAFDVRQGSAYRVRISLRPPQSVSGWTVGFRATGANVTFNFPPSALIPLDQTIMPLTPLWSVAVPNLTVVPGIQPRLPETGSVVEIYRDTTSDVGGGGVAVVDAALGIFDISMPRSITLEMPVDTYWWQFFRIDDDDYQVYSEGTLYVMSGA